MKIGILKNIEVEQNLKSQDSSWKMWKECYERSILYIFSK